MDQTSEHSPGTEARPAGLVLPGSRVVVPVHNARTVPAVDIHGFKIGLVADLRRPAFLAVVAEDGTMLDPQPIRIEAGAMIAVVLPETAAVLRAHPAAAGIKKL